MADTLSNKVVLVPGGTGSLGKVLVRRLLTGEMGLPRKIIIFSRDEAKQNDMRMGYKQMQVATDEIIYRKSEEILRFSIGDVRDFRKVAQVMRGVDIVFNAAALKQVPTCEYAPFEAVLTNVVGPVNIVRAINELRLPVETVVGISTDKACKPVNVMGMTKAVQERVFIQANLHNEQTRFVCVRYGNVLASRGSVIPLFHEQIMYGGPVTITTAEMTRFLLSLDQAVDIIFFAIATAKRGETYVPRVPSAKIVDLAEILIGDRPIKTIFSGIRPGEKTHEILVSEEEKFRTVERGNCYAIMPILPELQGDTEELQPLAAEYSSDDNVLGRKELRKLLMDNHLLEVGESVGELLR